MKILIERAINFAKTAKTRIITEINKELTEKGKWDDTMAVKIIIRRYGQLEEKLKELKRKFKL